MVYELEEILALENIVDKKSITVSRSLYNMINDKYNSNKHWQIMWLLEKLEVKIAYVERFVFLLIPIVLERRICNIIIV